MVIVTRKVTLKELLSLKIRTFFFVIVSNIGKGLSAAKKLEDWNQKAMFEFDSKMLEEFIYTPDGTKGYFMPGEGRIQINNQVYAVVGVEFRPSHEDDTDHSHWVYLRVKYRGTTGDGKDLQHLGAEKQGDIFYIPILPTDVDIMVEHNRPEE